MPISEKMIINKDNYFFIEKPILVQNRLGLKPQMKMKDKPMEIFIFASE